MSSVALILKFPIGKMIIVKIKIIPKKRIIDFLSLIFIKYITDKGIINNNPSYLINVAKAMHTKLKKNPTLSLFKNNAIVKTNKNIYNEKFIPSTEINNNLGSIMNSKLPYNAILFFTNRLKIKKAGIIVIVENTILVILCTSISRIGSDTSVKENINDKKLAHPVLVVVYPIGKLL